MTSFIVEKKESEASPSVGMMRCLRCKGRGLDRSGREPYRFVCSACGQHYIAVMKLVPVPSNDRSDTLVGDAGSSTGTEGGGSVLIESDR
jgi:hypothetical protein